MNGPVIIRPHQPTYFVKPGLHSHNTSRRLSHSSVAFAALRRVRVLLLVLGICGVGYYSYALSNQYIYQAYQNWAFDQQIAGRPVVSFADYLREKTPFGFLAGTKTAKPAVSISAPTPAPSEIPRPVEGSLLGRVEIGRLNLSAIVREGVDAKTLSVAVGHVPSTALPGQSGNFAIAAHRDTLFRGLKDIKKDDLVTFQSPAGTYTYQVVSTKIVKPSDISVLEPDGGGLIPATYSSSTSPAASEKLLTMITCYPFYYVGSAPKRFIVQAKLVSTDPGSRLPGNEAQNTGPPAARSTNSAMPTVVEPRSAKQASVREPRHPRGFSHDKRPHSRRVTRTDDINQTPKKRGFWHKLFRAG